MKDRLFGVVFGVLIGLAVAQQVANHIIQKRLTGLESRVKELESCTHPTLKEHYNVRRVPSLQGNLQRPSLTALSDG